MILFRNNACSNVILLECVLPAHLHGDLPLVQAETGTYQPKYYAEAFLLSPDVRDFTCLLKRGTLLWTLRSSYEESCRILWTDLMVYRQMSLPPYTG